ncbi:hypothetical protein [Leptospira andrefontaineae]|uniref:Uncharacterized protein n=1 Tax=Leptospira andrefontaineae TaxID=2484976 RepID=A0A4R9H6M9_9LEPT|nr:hypothetical protein [Leptospira andrefontaineae]TGK41253.1 hypothetical protein EHO65_07440 [Leptospira andrefontaineae]
MSSKEDLSAAGKRFMHALRMKGYESNKDISEFAKKHRKGVTTIYRYGRGESEIPEAFLDRLLHQESISKIFITKNKGVWKASLEEKMSLFDKDTEILKWSKTIKEDLNFARMQYLCRNLKEGELDLLGRIAAELQLASDYKLLWSLLSIVINLPPEGRETCARYCIKIEQTFFKKKLKQKLVLK